MKRRICRNRNERGRKSLFGLGTEQRCKCLICGYMTPLKTKVPCRMIYCPKCNVAMVTSDAKRQQGMINQKK